MKNKRFIIPLFLLLIGCKTHNHSSSVKFKINEINDSIINFSNSKYGINVTLKNDSLLTVNIGSIVNLVRETKRDGYSIGTFFSSKTTIEKEVVFEKDTNSAATLISYGSNNIGFSKQIGYLFVFDSIGFNRGIDFKSYDTLDKYYFNYTRRNF